MNKRGFFCKTMVFALLALVAASVIGGPIAYAQEQTAEARAAAIAQARGAWHYLGAALGLGLIVIGAGLGIGKFAAAAAEGIARQPAAAANITAAVNLPLFLLEGVAIIAEVVVLLIVLAR